MTPWSDGTDLGEVEGGLSSPAAGARPLPRISEDCINNFVAALVTLLSWGRVQFDILGCVQADACSTKRLNDEFVWAGLSRADLRQGLD